MGIAVFNTTWNNRRNIYCFSAENYLAVDISMQLLSSSFEQGLDGRVASNGEVSARIVQTGVAALAIASSLNEPYVLRRREA